MLFVFVILNCLDAVCINRVRQQTMNKWLWMSFALVLGMDVSKICQVAWTSLVEEQKQVFAKELAERSEAKKKEYHVAFAGSLLCHQNTCRGQLLYTALSADALGGCNSLICGMVEDNRTVHDTLYLCPLWYGEGASPPHPLHVLPRWRLTPESPHLKFMRGFSPQTPL